MKKLKILLFILLSISVLTITVKSANAVLDPHLDDNLNTPGYYCDRATGIYYYKHDCSIAPQFVQYCTINICQPSDQKYFCFHDDTGQKCNTQTGALSGPEAIIGFIQAPHQVSVLGSGSTGIGKFIDNLITIIYALAGIIFVFMILMGAIQWMTSGGDKEAITKARQRIVNAIIGLTLLAVTFVIVAVIGQITGFTLFAGQNVP